MKKGIKPDLSLIPIEAVYDMAKGLMDGEKTYARNDYKKGLPYTQLLGSLLRHTFLFLSGEDTDLDSGETHLCHMNADCAILSYLYHNCKQEDDR